jgi:hypothetical protein
VAGRVTEMDLLLSFASNVTGQPVTAESVTFSPHLQPIVFWSLSAAPVMIPFLAFNRFVRGTVGPLFISLALMMLLSTFFINDLVLYTPPGVWFAVDLKRVFVDATFQVLTVISLALSVAVAWFGLVWIARRYRRMKLSDQTFFSMRYGSRPHCGYASISSSSDSFTCLDYYPLSFTR